MMNTIYSQTPGEAGGGGEEIGGRGEGGGGVLPILTPSTNGK